MRSQRKSYNSFLLFLVQPADEEVPFRYSKALKKIPDSKFIAVYDLPHDFLKETDDDQVQMVFSRLNTWLNDH